MWAHDGSSTYRSLQAQYKRSVTAGQSVTVAYTWGQNRDNQGEGLNNTRVQAAESAWWTDSEWADSVADIRHRLVVGWVWDLPFGSDLTGLSGLLVKGWQISGIGTFQSGSPIFVTQDGDVLNTDPTTSSAEYMEIRPNLVAGQDPNLPQKRTRLYPLVQHRGFCQGHRHLRQLSAQPGFGARPHILRHLAGQVVPPVGAASSYNSGPRRFNALNTPLWGNPNGILGNSNFGRITSATNREMQFGLRYSF